MFEVLTPTVTMFGDRVLRRAFGLEEAIRAGP